MFPDKSPEEELVLNENQLKIYNETKNWIYNLPETVLGLVSEYEHVMLGNKTVVCTAILNTGYEITAYSAPVDIQHFNLELGRILAKKKVLEELLSLERYYNFNLNHSARDRGYNENIISNGLGYENLNEKEEN